MDAASLRKAFLDYFEGKGHKVVASSPLVPGNDPTLLFTNAGMVQFKDVFLGTDKRSYTRAASSQRCVRAGGKHNDLENVGYTARHHTFFEMLGNFSFGDYFKEEAIEYGWEFLTQTMGLPEDRLWVTVFREDDEAADIWLNKIGVSPDRFSRLGEKDNFWSMGDTGPCGPCSEIFYDHGADVPGGPPGSPDEDGDRYVEIWNLVFMQFDRAADGTLTSLPKPSVDTGMGLERIAAVLQGVHSNYQIDLFAALIKAAGEATATTDLGNNSLKVIADHIRACSFLIVDGVLPGNEGRGYVLRRIIRRALRHGHKLGRQEPFFYQLVAPLIAQMGAAYPELAESKAHVEKVLRTEEEKFSVTLAGGMKLLGSETSMALPALRKLQEELGGEIGLGWQSGDGTGLDGTLIFPSNRTAVEVLRESDISRDYLLGIMRAFQQAQESENDYDRLVFLGIDFPAEFELDEELAALLDASDINIDSRFYDAECLKPYRMVLGETAFKLFDTYGFPVDLTVDAAREMGFEVDTAGFEASMQKQRERSRAASRFDAVETGLQSDEVTKFTGYEKTADAGRVVSLLRDGQNVDRLEQGESGIVVLFRTPFYAESGGQVGDVGTIGHDNASFVVNNTQKSGSAHLHMGKVLSGALVVGDTVTTVVDADKRNATALNHTATHLLHAALREVLGAHVAQKGSLVDPDRLRFDFSHYEHLTADELSAIERLVNTKIRDNEVVETSIMNYDEAVSTGAVALFGEKYDDEVRVLRVGDFSVELCGGTHAQRAGDIGLFKITNVSGIASGVRRIEALTGEGALTWVAEQQQLVTAVSSLLRAAPAELADKIGQTLEKQKALEKEVKKLRADLAAGGAAGNDLTAGVQEIGGIQVLAARLPDDTDAGSLRDTVDRMKDKLGTAVVVLGAATTDGKVRLAAGVTKNATDRVRAGDLVSTVADQVGGKGGGRPDFAQAGGSDPEALDRALASVSGWVEATLSS
jgi:alanyl-tRNA synthetase